MVSLGRRRVADWIRGVLVVQFSFEQFGMLALLLPAVVEQRETLGIDELVRGTWEECRMWWYRTEQPKPTEQNSAASQKSNSKTGFLLLRFSQCSPLLIARGGRFGCELWAEGTVLEGADEGDVYGGSQTANGGEEGFGNMEPAHLSEGAPHTDEGMGAVSSACLLVVRRLVPTGRDSS